MRRDNRVLVGLVAGLVVFPALAIAAPAGAQTSGNPAPTCVPHPPIEITEERGRDGFVLGEDPVTGEPIYRPGSGVVAGNGSAENPYVIEGWCLPTSGTTEPVGEPARANAIVIENTTSHVEIRDNEIEGDGARTVRLSAPLVGVPDPVIPSTPGETTGIVLEATANVAIRNNTFDEVSPTAMRVEGTPGIEIANNTFDHPSRPLIVNPVKDTGPRSILVVDSPNPVLRSNEMLDPTRPVKLVGSDGAEVVDNRFELADRALKLVDSAQATIAENTIVSARKGIVFKQGSGQARVVENEVDGSLFTAGDGVRVVDSDGVLVEDNEIDSFRDNVKLLRSENSVVDSNELETAVSEDVVVRNAQNNTVRDNLIRQDQRPRTGAQGVKLVKARQNRVVKNTFQNAGFKLRASAGNAIVENDVTNNDRIGSTVKDSDENTFADNQITQRRGFEGNGFAGDDGLVFTGSDANTIEGNRFGGGAGLTLDDGSDGTLIEGNTFQGNADPGVLEVRRSDDTRIVANVVTESPDVGILVRFADGTQVHRNNIEANADAGLLASGGGVVNATANWWGASEGPSGGLADACTGTIADGSGDAIATRNDGAICFDPFLEAANPDAGVSS